MRLWRRQNTKDAHKHDLLTPQNMRLQFLKVPSDGNVGTLHACPLALVPHDMFQPFAAGALHETTHTERLTALGSFTFGDCRIEINNSRSFVDPVTNVVIEMSGRCLLTCRAVTPNEDPTPNLVLTLVLDPSKRLALPPSLHGYDVTDAEDDNQAPCGLEEYDFSGVRVAASGQGTQQLVLATTTLNEPLRGTVDGVPYLLVVTEPHTMVLKPFETETVGSDETQAAQVSA